MNSIRIAAMLVVALATTACGTGTDTPSAMPSTPAVTAAVPTPVPTATPTASPPSPLEGTWTTRVTTCADKLAAVRKAEFTDAQIAASGWTCPPEPTRERMRFFAGRLLSFNTDGSVGWDGLYRIVDDETFEAGDNGTYYITYHYVLDGDQLTVTNVEDNSPGKPGPGLWGEQIAQTAGWTTAPFTRTEMRMPGLGGAMSLILSGRASPIGGRRRRMSGTLI
jgi:hypothetical protein